MIYSGRDAQNLGTSLQDYPKDFRIGLGHSYWVNCDVPSRVGIGTQECSKHVILGQGSLQYLIFRTTVRTNGPASERANERRLMLANITVRLPRNVNDE